ncbi:MAG: hypothetical protein ACQERC_06905 [Bacteroidota bacterium]
MKKRGTLLLLFILSGVLTMAQTPQNITQQSDKNESLWNSTSAIIFVAIFIVLMIVGRLWSKKVQKKRDEIANKDDE